MGGVSSIGEGHPGCRNGDRERSGKVKNGVTRRKKGLRVHRGAQSKEERGRKKGLVGEDNRGRRTEGGKRFKKTQRRHDCMKSQKERDPGKSGARLEKVTGEGDRLSTDYVRMSRIVDCARGGDKRGAEKNDERK